MTLRIPNEPPIILPVKEAVYRPRWSVMIPAYNCSEFLADAINSVLLQDPGETEMQIEVVDDASTDSDVEALVMKIGKGRVSYFRQPENMGSLRNFETCINRATGQYIHLLHGDDRVKPGFYAAIESLFNDYPDAGAAFTNWDFINADGSFINEETPRSETNCIIDNCLQKLSHGQMMQYVCMVVKRSVYEDLGAFYGVTYGEDWVMWARIAQKYPIAYTPLSMAEYRTHYNSITGHSFLNGKNISDLRIVFDTISQMLPPSERAHASLAVRKNYSLWAIDAAKYMWMRTGKRQVIYYQVYNLFLLYPNRVVFAKSVSLVVFVWKQNTYHLMRRVYRKIFK